MKMAMWKRIVISIYANRSWNGVKEKYDVSSMNEKMIECKYCDSEISYISSANFIVFCPHCKRETLLECEYGYGPETPCQILLGEKLFATVKDSNGKYILEMQSDGKKIKLKEKYLEALKEAGGIISGFLKPGIKHSVEPIKIKKKGGTLCFYGDWFGRPYDNYHKIVEYSYKDEVLEIVFDMWERLIVIQPSGIINTEKEFSIEHAEMVKWSWYPYGSSREKMNKISYTVTDDGIYKESKQGKQRLLIKEQNPAVSIV